MEMETQATRMLAKTADVAAATTRVWTLDDDQRIVGVCCAQNEVSLVVAGARSVQIRSLAQPAAPATTAPFASGSTALQRALDGGERYYVAWARGDAPAVDARLLDAVEMEFLDLDEADGPRASSSGRSADATSVHAACVDAGGQHVAFVETTEADTRWRLRCWSRTDHERRGEWMTTSPEAMAGRRRAWAMRFVQTTMFGRCLAVVCMAEDEKQWLLHHQLFAVREGVWTLLRERHTELDLGSSSSHELQLSPSCRWLTVVERRTHHVQCVPLDLFGAKHATLAKQFDEAVVDVAWRGDVLAVLLTNGRVHFLQPQSSTLAEIASPINASMQLEPRQRGHVEWNTVLWVTSRQSLLLGAGSCVVEVPVSVANPPPVLVERLATRPLAEPSAFQLSAPPHRRRRRQRQQSSPVNTAADLDRIVASTASQTTLIDLLDTARVTLRSNDLLNVDVVLTLLGILLQRVLHRLGFGELGANDDVPIQIGIMEMLLAQVVTGDAIGIRRTAENVTRAPGFPSRSARRSYYAREMQWLLSIQSSRREIGSSLFPFRDAIQDRVVELLNACGSTVAESSFSLLDATAVMNAIDRQGAMSPWIKLQALLLSCITACDFYHTDCAVLDIDLLLTIISLTDHKRSIFRSSFVLRFVSLQYSRLRSTTFHENRVSLPSAALRLAQASDSLSHFVEFCTALNVSDPYALLIAHQTHNQSKIKREIDPRLSRSIAMEIIDRSLVDLIALIHHSPLLPRLCHPHTSLSASIDQFVKLVFVSTDTYIPFEESIVHGPGQTEFPFCEEEAALRTKTLRLARLVVQQLIYLNSLSSEPSNNKNGDEAIAAVVRKLFLFDSLWLGNSQATEKSKQKQTKEREAMWFLQARECYGRITGSTTIAVTSTPHLSQRVLRSLRSLASVLWTHWVRERCAIVKAMLETPGGIEEGKSLGTMAGWGALHLKTLALYRDESDHEEILSLQLTFLESAACLDAMTASRVLQWGFPVESINARYQKRFRVLRATVADTETNDAVVAHYKRELCQAVMKRPLSCNGESSTTTDEIDAFGVCCCDSDFQRVVWALAQRRFLVVIGGETAPRDSDRTEMKKVLQSHPSGVNGLISRHEVVQLLKAQRLEIEEQMRRVRREADESDTPGQHATTAQPIQASFQVTEMQSPVSAPRIKSYSIRELSSSPRAEQLASPTKTVLRKGSSTQNILKLLQLRKDQQEIKRHQSAPRLVPVALSPKRAVPVETTRLAVSSQPTPMPTKKHGPPSSQPTAFVERMKDPQPSATSQPTPMPVRKKPPPPLRRDHPEQAELVLLTAGPRSGKRKSVPLKRKSFQLQTIPPVNGLSHVYHIPLEEDIEAERVLSQATQCTTLKTTSVQTEHTKDEETSTAIPTETTTTSPQPRPTRTEDMGVQADIAQAKAPASREEGEHPSDSASVAARFPVYVELPDSVSANKKGFIHVAALAARSVEATAKPQERVAIVRAPLTEPHAPEATEQCSNLPVEMSTDQDKRLTVDDSNDQLIQLEAQRRHTYRSHFPASTHHYSGTGSSVGMDSFVSLKMEMERMKAKLLELETSAENLDNEFKVSHLTLETMGTRRPGRVMEQVDEAITESAVEEGESSRATGVLSSKATRDLAGARHLLARIEQLTSGE